VKSGKRASIRREAATISDIEKSDDPWQITKMKALRIIDAMMPLAAH
jgi:hypothetical protein